MPLRHVGGMTTAQLRDMVKSVGGSSFHGELTAAMAATAHRELLRGFQLSRDPYGKAWAPVDRFQFLKGGRQGPARRGKPLIVTGELRASAVVAPTSDGLTIGLASDHAAPHQFGTKGRKRKASARRARKAAAAGAGGIRRRQMIPTAEDGGLGLWKAPLDETAKKVMKRWVGR
jgi:phage gpG-like protein